MGEGALQKEARRLLASEPRGAEACARRLLAARPDDRQAVLLLGAALRRAGDPQGAARTLEPALAADLLGWGLHFELGAAYAALGRSAAAVERLRRAVALNPSSSLAWHALGDQLAVIGDQSEADAAQARPLPGSVADPALRAGAAALFEGDHGAGRILEDGFGLHPTDVTASRLLADLAVRMGRLDAAETLLEAALRSAPAFLPAQSARAAILLRRDEPEAALTLIDELLRLAPASSLHQALAGAARLQLGDPSGSIEAYAAALERCSGQPRVWISLGHALKAAGRQGQSVAAYRRSLQLDPLAAEAYWSLANLKVVRFTAADRQAMQTALQGSALRGGDRVHLHFAVAKAFEDERDFPAAFAHYEEANALRRAAQPYDASANRAYVARCQALFTAEFFAARRDVGCPSPDPIFVVGLPRSGTTLVEQILASHSAVEGASELPDLMIIARRETALWEEAARRAAAPAAEGSSRPAPAYPALLASLPPERFAELGAAYLQRTRSRRRLGRVFFVDKAPGNALQIGLIHLILPHAKIIDVRRHPMACCFSAYKQDFAEGAAYSASLEDLGRYYADYRVLMDHFDKVLPGRIGRVSYEDLVRSPEAEIRRLLTYCGLEFEPACLRFHESERPVRSASSEQVRQPLFTEGLDHWRHFEPWLDGLRAHLPGDGA
jgi:tetratricopeptide (TPR) repeat protein